MVAGSRDERSDGARPVAKRPAYSMTRRGVARHRSVRDTGYRVSDFARDCDTPTNETERFALDCVQPAGVDVVARCVVTYGDQVLLCRRADDPRRGMWNIPGGYQESGETPLYAARREAYEEAYVVLAKPALLGVYRLRQLQQLTVVYVAQSINGSHAPGPESLETRLFSPEDIPWDDLAFPTDAEALHTALSIMAGHTTQPHVAELYWNSDGYLLIRDD
jgi:ADP-ribose pyrophosphatase YjhB (NUDIX family)